MTDKLTAFVVLLDRSVKLHKVCLVILQNAELAQQSEDKCRKRVYKRFFENAHCKQHDKRHLHHSADADEKLRRKVKAEEHIEVEQKRNEAQNEYRQRVHRKVQNESNGGDGSGYAVLHHKHHGGRLSSGGGRRYVGKIYVRCCIDRRPTALKVTAEAVTYAAQRSTLKVDETEGAGCSKHEPDGRDRFEAIQEFIKRKAVVRGHDYINCERTERKKNNQPKHGF